MGRGLFLRGQPHPQSKETGSERSTILGFLSSYAYTLCCRTTKFDVVTRVAEMRLSWSQPRLPSQESEIPQRSPVLGVLWCLHPLTQNDQIRHGITYGEGRVIWGQPRRCVARFVSDSWVFLVSHLPLWLVFDFAYCLLIMLHYLPALQRLFFSSNF